MNISKESYEGSNYSNSTYQLLGEVGEEDSWQFPLLDNVIGFFSRRVANKNNLKKYSQQQQQQSSVKNKNIKKDSC